MQYNCVYYYKTCDILTWQAPCWGRGLNLRALLSPLKACSSIERSIYGIDRRV
jgi:hypothetical protein